MQTGFEFFTDEQRLNILKAAQAGQYEQVEILLSSAPKLIAAKTKTKGHSLLHVAAQHGHKRICELLLSRGHEPNPVDFDGYTPYQKTKCERIRAILVAAHSRSLFDHTIFHDQAQNSCEILNRASFFEFISLISKEKMALEVTFAVTGTREDLGTTTYFREEGLMTPYFGELLVAHEEEQVRTSQSQIDLGEREIRAYANGILTVLDRYPELVGFPLSTDLPHVAHAKKLIIISGLLGFASYAQDFSAKNAAKFQELVLNHRHVREAYGIALTTLNGDNLKLVRKFKKEIEETYAPPSSTPPNVNRP